MKRLFWLLSLAFGITRLSAQTVTSFRFSRNPPSSSELIAGWISAIGDPSQSVVTASDPATGISISSVNTANWFPNGDVCAFDGAGVQNASYFPWPVLGSAWLQQGGAQAQFNAAIPQLEISGLHPDSVYYIRMSSSYLYGTDGDPTQYTVSGLNMLPSQYLTIGGNLTSGITFQNVAPDANGKIRVYVNTTSTTDLAQISGLQIISGSAQIAMPIVHITSPDNNDILAEESNIVINATATETGGAITRVEFFADTVKIGESTTAPYSITWTNPDEGHYLITAKATDGTGTTGTSTINISIESLTSFWSMTGNIGMNADSNFIGNVDSVRLAFRTKNIERMSISPLGNVGIGTINPTAQLHTTGTVRMAGLKNDSTNSQPRMLVADTSGNLYYRNVGSGGTGSVGEGLGQSAGGVALGDSIPGPGPHSFSSNRYQFLNGHFYSIGGSVNDPVTHPAFRIYDNGDMAVGTTMDTSVSTSDQTGFRFFKKSGYMQIGASDRPDTTQNPIVYGNWPSSALIINSDEPNILKGKLINTIFTANSSKLDSGAWMENNFISGEQLNFSGSANTFIRSFIGGYSNTFQSPVESAVIDAENVVISKPFSMGMISGLGHQTQDSSNNSLISGLRVQFGGFGQFAAGQFLIDRTPFGTVLGHGNVDFTTLPYTGTQGIRALNIGSYPLFALGNSTVYTNPYENLAATSKSNAFTVLYNGRTQINTTGATNNLSQTDVTPKAALDVVSTNTGVLLPRLTNAQRNAIVSGDLQNGLLLYNTDVGVFQYYNGSAWNSVGSGSGGGSVGWQSGSGAIYDSTDNVGIGTSNTQGYKLAVNGAAIFTRIKVKAVGFWPDYVFRRDYHLPDLKTLEKYIVSHQHLPDVPAESDVKKDGQDVGETQAVLLRKVEELTLYVIDLNKKVEALQKENTRLKTGKSLHRSSNAKTK